MFSIRGIALAFCFSALLIAGAEVIHTGGSLNIAGGFYVGDCNNVKTPSGNITVSCHLILQSGEPVSATTHVSYMGGNVFGPELLPCEGVLTKSGNANVTCHN